MVFKDIKYLNYHKVVGIKNSLYVMMTEPLKLLNIDKNDIVKVQVIEESIIITFEKKGDEMDVFKYT